MKTTMSLILEKQVQEKQNWNTLCDNEWAMEGDHRAWGEGEIEEENVYPAGSKPALEVDAVKILLGVVCLMGLVTPPLQVPETLLSSQREEIANEIAGPVNDRQRVLVYGSQQQQEADNSTLPSSSTSKKRKRGSKISWSSKRRESGYRQRPSGIPEMTSRSKWTDKTEALWKEFKDSRDLLWLNYLTCQSPSKQNVEVQDLFSYQQCDVRSISHKLRRLSEYYENQQKEGILSDIITMKEENPVDIILEEEIVSDIMIMKDQSNSITTNFDYFLNETQDTPHGDKSKTGYQVVKQLRVDGIKMLRKYKYDDIFERKKKKPSD